MATPTPNAAASVPNESPTDPIPNELMSSEDRNSALANSTIRVEAGKAQRAAPASKLADPPLVNDEQVVITLEALAKAEASLPLDDDLSTPRAIEANMVRRSQLSHAWSRLQVAHRRVNELLPIPTMLADWVSTLEACQADLANQLTTAEAAAKGGVPGGELPIRAERRVTNLRYALHDVAHGPDYTTSGEFMFGLSTLGGWCGTTRMPEGG